MVALDILQEKVDLINNRVSPIQDNEIEEYLKTKELNLTATINAEETHAGALFDNLHPSRIVVVRNLSVQNSLLTY